jgi:hypothetical protein
MNKEFEVHILNEVGIAKARAIATAFDDLLENLKNICGFPLVVNGREMSIVRTKLEEASFFAKKTMAEVPENQR